MFYLCSRWQFRNTKLWSYLSNTKSYFIVILFLHIYEKSFLWTSWYCSINGECALSVLKLCIDHLENSNVAMNDSQILNPFKCDDIVQCAYINLSYQPIPYLFQWAPIKTAKEDGQLLNFKNNNLAYGSTTCDTECWFWDTPKQWKYTYTLFPIVFCNLSIDQISGTNCVISLGFWANCSFAKV